MCFLCVAHAQSALGKHLASFEQEARRDHTYLYEFACHKPDPGDTPLANPWLRFYINTTDILSICVFLKETLGAAVILTWRALIHK